MYTYTINSLHTDITFRHIFGLVAIQFPSSNQFLFHNNGIFNYKYYLFFVVPNMIIDKLKITQNDYNKIYYINGYNPALPVPSRML